MPPEPPSPTEDLTATPVQDAASSEQSRRLSQSRSLPPGHVPGFEVERQLGEGAYGSVWLARELKTGKQVAIKFYTRRRGLDWSLLCREVEKLAVLYTSRNVVGLLDVGWDQDPPYFVMEYLPSGSLDERLRAGALPVETAVQLAGGVARALVHAHRNGILHCDVKPANILLDANAEPRLGDFGQSRLTTEHSPSLGTLYYMAPEQAVLDGVPDHRWDVYAVGALLYHMLTGAPPYASPESERALRAARALPQRLEVYRQLLRSNPRPQSHREVSGVDPALAELIDRCLHPDPQQRLPSVERVVELLERRERSRVRRPLVALGFLGPILFLFAMYWIAERAVPRVVAAAEQNLIDRALASDGVSARILADGVQRELRERQARLAELAAAAELPRLIEQSAGLSDLELLARCQSDGDRERDEFAWLREQIAAVQSQLAGDDRTPDDSWFVTDARGRQVFRSPPQEQGRGSTLGKFFHWRDYFHGQGHDLDPATPVGELSPRGRPGVSVPFRSQATGEYMVALDVPVLSPEGAVLGVLARTIRLTALLQQWEVRLRDEHTLQGPPDADAAVRFLVLAESRDGALRILDHPGLTSVALAQRSPAEFESLLQFDAAAADELGSRLQSDHVRDPLGSVLPQFTGEWLAAAAPVGDTGWLAIVQERRDHTVQPVDNLRQVFQRAGFWALGIFGVLLMVLWFLIRRATV